MQSVKLSTLIVSTIFYENKSCVCINHRSFPLKIIPASRLNNWRITYRPSINFCKETMTKLFSYACKHVADEITHGCRVAVGWLILFVELLHKSITGTATIPRGMERRGVCCAFRHASDTLYYKNACVKMKKKREKERKRKREERITDLCNIWYSLARIFSKTDRRICILCT